MNASSRNAFILCLLVCILPPQVSWAKGASSGASVPPALLDTLAVMALTGRMRAADSVATASVALLEHEPIGDSLALAKMLTRQSNYRRLRGLLRDGTALAAVQRALVIGERLRPFDARNQARTHLAAALIHIDLQEGDSALAHAGHGEMMLRAMVPPDDSLLAVMLYRKANAQRLLNDYPSAITTLEEARERAVRRLGPDAPQVGSICSELGRNLIPLGEFDRARAELERGVGIADRNRQLFPARLESALSSLVMLERRAGNRARAVELGTQVYDLYVARQGPTGIDAPVHLTNLVSALVALGDFPRALTLLEQVLEQETLRLPPAHAGVLQDRITLANVHAKLGDSKAARAQLDLVDSLLTAGGSKDRNNIAYSTVVHTYVDVIDSRFAEARRRLLETASAAPLDIASRSDLVCSLYETLTVPEDVPLADSLGKAVDAWAETSDVERTKNWANTLFARSAAEARLGQRGPAWEHALQSEAVATARFRREVEALPDRAAMLLDEDEANPATVLVDLARPDRPDEVRRAWEAVIERRGAILDVIAARRTPRSGADTALAGAHARWVAASRHHAQLLVSGVLDGDDPSTKARLETSRATAEAAEGAYARLAATTGHATDAVTLDRVLAKLQPNEALVAFVRTQPHVDDASMTALIAPPDGKSPRIVRLAAEAPIAALVHAWTALLATPPQTNPSAARRAESAARAAGEALRKRIWDPLLPAIGNATDVRIVAAGPLLDLPWLALPGTSGRYLAEGMLRIRVDSAERDLLREVEPGGSGLLAVGDPDFDHRGESVAAAASPAFSLRGLPGVCARSDEVLGSLPGAREEARAIAERWKETGSVELLMGSEATEESFKRLAPGHRLIHLATHGILTRDSCLKAGPVTRGVGGVVSLDSGGTPAKRRPPGAATKSPAPPAFDSSPSPWLGRETWLAFAGANRASERVGDENEGWLTADEVVTLDLRGTQRVVLSACQSGVVDRWTHEAVLGMRRAFHLAGARCVLASQWPIADQSTRALMEAFYASPSPSAEFALQEACHDVIAARRSRGATTHPFYWAAFTVTGD